MKTRSKLKGPIGRVYPLALMILYFLIAVEIIIRYSIKQTIPGMDHFPFYMVIVFGVFFITMGILQFIRYRLWDHLVLGLFMGIGSLLTISAHAFTAPVFILLWCLNALLLGLFLILRWTVLRGHERYESNARRLMKLAVDTIEESSDGYTGRPFPAGQVEAGKGELLGFARMMGGKNITRFFLVDDTVFLCFSLNKSLLVGTHPEEYSHIAISPSGEVMVTLTNADYQQYSKTFNFNQLCASLGNIFNRFFTYYKQGMDDRIINELKSVL